jgi:hypothetical protein
VSYGYDVLSRLTSVTDPTAATGETGYSYGAPNTIDDNLSLLSAITNTSGTDLAGTSSEDFADYTYLGPDTIVDTAHPGVVNGLDLTMGNAQNGYNAFDQWGRVVDQLWETAGQDSGSLDFCRGSRAEASWV